MVELSVIIPTYNRAGPLRTCLDALDRQTHPVAEYEVVVVVDGSTDGTDAMLRTLSPRYRFRVIRQRNAGQPSALNRGIDAATGTCCLFLDDDIIAEPALIAEHVGVHRTHGAAIGIGNIPWIVDADADWFAGGFGRVWNAHFESLTEGRRRPAWYDCYGGNMSAPRAALLDVGGVAGDLNYSHDIELAYRLHERGLRLVYLPRAVGCEHQLKGFRELAVDCERHGAAAVELLRRHPSAITDLLGHFGNVGPRMLAARRLLLALNPPLPLLAPIGRALYGTGAGPKWFRLTQDYCFWRGVRRAIGGSKLWHDVTRGVLGSDHPPAPGHDDAAASLGVKHSIGGRRAQWSADR
ncbi:MAG TPA: glycosyltransferase family 2 protein [Gemmatimonadales bacterium]|nr:glycosyltransferase family 2 protein [Gemmatimonadales bacterium]